MTDTSDFDAQALVDYLGGDPVFAAEMIDLFFEDTAKSMAGVRSAAAAGDYDQLRESAHALKGNSANIRAPAFRDYAQQLEEAAKNRSPDLPQLLERLDAEYNRVTEVLRSWQRSVRTQA